MSIAPQINCLWSPIYTAIRDQVEIPWEWQDPFFGFVEESLEEIRIAVISNLDGISHGPAS